MVLDLEHQRFVRLAVQADEAEVDHPLQDEAFRVDRVVGVLRVGVLVAAAEEHADLTRQRHGRRPAPA